MGSPPASFASPFGGRASSSWLTLLIGIMFVGTFFSPIALSVLRPLTTFVGLCFGFLVIGGFSRQAWFNWRETLFVSLILDVL